jgi:3-phenylpropionate/trans-cinnamate dioxygenase ferredoxin reductase component
MPRYDVVIVGTGHAGAQAAAALRKEKYAGSIAMLGEEAGHPYERPPLSKEYLVGGKGPERLLIRPPAFWDSRNICVLGGHRVTVVDPGAGLVRTEDGREFAYGHLIWAAGGNPRRLTCDGHNVAGVHTLRTRSDADAIRRDLRAAHSVAVVGGGYIGLEAAASFVKLGKQVTVLEAQQRVLARVAGEPLSRFYEQEHRAHGVDIRLGVSVAGIERSCGSVARVRLLGDADVPADLIVVGIGIVPAVSPLLAAGAEGSQVAGVAVDGQCRTTLPRVFAVGDCALHASRYAGGAQVRIESVQNAHDQAAVVAGVLTGADVEYDAVPWFWSNQYDLRLQMVGLSAGHDDVVLRGDPASRAFTLVYLRDRRVVALDCVNAAKDYTHGRRLVAEGPRVDQAAVADPRIPLSAVAVP